jgi:hypothetical protein
MRLRRTQATAYDSEASDDALQILSALIASSRDEEFGDRRSPGPPSPNNLRKMIGASITYICR